MSNKKKKSEIENKGLDKEYKGKENKKKEKNKVPVTKKGKKYFFNGIFLFK